LIRSHSLSSAGCGKIDNLIKLEKLDQFLSQKYRDYYFPIPNWFVRKIGERKVKIFLVIYQRIPLEKNLFPHNIVNGRGAGIDM